VMPTGAALEVAADCGPSVISGFHSRGFTGKALKLNQKNHPVSPRILRPCYP
jgi:hypothetical protein